MRVAVTLAGVLWLLSMGVPAMAQGQLANIRDDIKGESRSSSSHDSKDSGHSSGDDDDFGLTFDFAGMFHDPSEWRLFPPYPYPRGVPGYMQLDPGPEGKICGHTAEELDLSPWSFRLSVENGTNFDDINRFAGTLQVETRLGLGLWTNWNYLYEDLGHGYYDDLVLGNITLTWRFLESRRLIMRWGVGAWIATDTWGGFHEAGVNVHLSADYFPVRPFVLSGVLEVGSLGDTNIAHARFTAGVLWRGVEFYGGYDFMHIGDTDLHTPMVGVRFWF